MQALFDRITKEKRQRNELQTPHHQLVAEWQTLNRK